MTKVDVGGEIVVPPRRRLRVSPPLAWITVTPFALWAVARLAGLDAAGVGVSIMTGTPYVAAASVVAVLAALSSRRRIVIATAVATTAALAAVVLPRAVGSAPTATATGPTLRILTANLFYGVGDAEAVVGLVRRLDPDVLSTQELTPQAVEALDAAGLGRLLPYRHLEDGPGASGSGLYSRHPLTRLPDFAPEGSHRMPRARIALPSGPPVEIVDVHTLSPVEHDVALWAADLAALPSASPGVVRVLAGDFNASLDHAALRAVLARGYADAAGATGHGLAATWPANRRFPALITIDHVLYDRRAAAVDAGVHTVPESDHRAFFAEIRLPGRL
ncbi:endonuclease/exonuclease/phosphatase family protein [Microbispora cellulosiformans]|uniref:Endonuclease/exonuclease/phosphatase family protein n=1 Tax=Microbispora cellulosiformans TaxID=2614688 RepID=A0A5J5JXU8_9ACTN|nr:endonuclease/exonuclease/phosphatase family protein [Microbispora cellulosiformans]KAA9375075.1 endonuclease/exonuclease/phosphatase family protein [Microbispora cellulosiformans]